MPDAPTAADSQSEATPTGTANTADATEEADSQPTVSVENGRRRGRRRVMKKKKVKDEDGYLGKYISQAMSDHTDQN
jgi:DNA polymerase delta subunit 3